MEKEGTFSMNALKGVGILSHRRVLLSMMKGEGRGVQGDELKMGDWSIGLGGRGVCIFLMYIVILIGFDRGCKSRG